MTTAELLKIMAEVVADSQACVLEVLMNDSGAVAHLIPLEAWKAEEGDYDDD